MASYTPKKQIRKFLDEQATRQSPSFSSGVFGKQNSFVVVTPRTVVLKSLVRRVMSKRKADLIVGPSDNPTMERWRIFSTKYVGLYAHRFLRDDADNDLHDHPWASLSWLLSGQYIEVTELGDLVHKAGTFKYRKPTYRHRIRLGNTQEDVITLFLVGRKVRKWGFWRDGGFEGGGK